MIKTENPVNDMEAFFADLEECRLWRHRNEERPDCIICGKPIKEDTCYILPIYGEEDFHSCMCNDCKRKEAAKLDYYTADIFDETLSNYWRDTPIKDKGYSYDDSRYEMHDDLIFC